MRSLDAVMDLVRSVQAEFRWRPGHIIMLEAFFDEAGTHGDAPLVWMAGVAFDGAGLEAFVRAWAAKTQGLQRPFRTSPCVFGSAPFEDWSAARRHALLGSLGGLISEHALYRVAAAVDPAELRALRSAEPFVEANVVDAPTLALQVCMTMIEDRMKEQALPGNVRLWLELGDTAQQASANAHLAHVKRVEFLERKFHVENFSFANKRCMPAFAAPDFLAWSLNRHATGQGFFPGFADLPFRRAIDGCYAFRLRKKGIRAQAMANLCNHRVAPFMDSDAE